MRPPAVLLTLDDDVGETRELVESLGFEVAEVVQQNRSRPDPQTFLGRGKLASVAPRLAEHGARLVVVDGDLKPGQIFLIEDLLADELRESGDLETLRELPLADVPRGPDQRGIPSLDPMGGPFEVADRVRVILEIFRERARSKEARLQVELAKLRYEMPIVREAIHRAKTGEHPGFLAGGEQDVDTYYDRMTKRMARIREELDRLSGEREVRRKHRRRGGFHLVSLAGYTNAGKSSLLRALTDEEVQVEDRVFTTLTTTTRRIENPRRNILATDTVGFIADLPPWLVEAFHSTLEEVALADVILLVVDASDPLGEVRRKLSSSLDTLHGFANRRFDGSGSADGGGALPDGEIPAVHDRRSSNGRAGGDGAAGSDGGSLDQPGLAPILVVLNKTDRLRGGELDALVRSLEEDDLLLHPWVATSAYTGAGLARLEERVVDLLPPYDAYEMELPQSPATESFVAWLHDEADVRSVDRGEAVEVRFEAREQVAGSIADRVEDLDAEVREAPASFDGHPTDGDEGIERDGGASDDGRSIDGRKGQDGDGEERDGEDAASKGSTSNASKRSRDPVG